MIFFIYIFFDVEKICDYVLVLIKCGIYFFEELKGKKLEENYLVCILIKVIKFEVKVLFYNY